MYQQKRTSYFSKRSAPVQKEAVSIAEKAPPMPPPKEKEDSTEIDPLPFRTHHSLLQRENRAGTTTTKAQIKGPSPGVAIPVSVQEPTAPTEMVDNRTFSKIGLLKIETFLPGRAVPIPGVNIVVSQVIEGVEHIFANAMTNEVGILNDVRLPAPDSSTSLSPDLPFPYATYLVSAAKQGFFVIPAQEIQIFDGVKTIIPLVMQLDLEGGTQNGISDS